MSLERKWEKFKGGPMRKGAEADARVTINRKGDLYVMPDVLTPEQRKLNMSRIRGQDTKPELYVRSLVHSLGYRYRLHVKELSGNPTLFFGNGGKLFLSMDASFICTIVCMAMWCQKRTLNFGERSGTEIKSATDVTMIFCANKVGTYLSSGNV